MIRPLFFLTLIAAGLWYLFRPGGPQLHLPSIPGITASSSINGCRSSLRTVERSVLQPLGKPNSIDPAKAIHDLKTKLAGYRNDPDYPRLSQAAGLLQQALQERAKFLQKTQAGSQEQRLDHIPGNWHRVDHPEQSIDWTSQNRNARGGFFAQAAAREWNDRAAAYHTAIERLAAPAPRRGADPRSPAPTNRGG